ncbi:hypothetical protein ACS0TY_024088 [Phlomoides rotata]
MSCNGCRVLRRGCTDDCIIRPCLEWIQSPQAQGNATLFVSKFFGRSDLMSFIAGVPANKRPALFQSLLFEACGRTANPVSGAVGLLSTGNWHICQAAVETVLAGGVIQPVSVGTVPDNGGREAEELTSRQKSIMHGSFGFGVGESPLPSFRGSRNCVEKTASFGSGISEISPEFGKGENGVSEVGSSKKPKLLNLFA